MPQQPVPAPRRLTRASMLPLLVLLAACSHDVLDPAGDVARQQRNIIYISTGLMLLIIVPVLILIVLFAWRYRKGKGGTYDPDFDHSTTLELVIWSAPLLIIIMLGALTWSSTHLLDPFRPLDQAATGQEARAPQPAPLRVQVVSLDWKWLFIYPDLGIAAVNELVLPVNRQVRFDLTSSNMMNTFYAPTLAGMIYTMPGMQSTLHAVLNRAGDWQGYSGNYSGAGFADMKFGLHGVDQAGFDRWVAAARASGQALDDSAYLQLAHPSERAPVVRFGSVDTDLFRRIVERCVAPGTPCMSQLRAHEDAGHAMMPPRGDTAPQGPQPQGGAVAPRLGSGARPSTGNPALGPGVLNPGPDGQSHLGSPAGAH